MLALTLFVLTTNISANVRRYEGKGLSRNIKKINNVKNKIAVQKKSITSISFKISQLENDLGQENKRFIKIIKIKKYLDTKIDSAEKALLQNKKELQEALVYIEKMARRKMLHGIDDNVDVPTLLIKNLMQKRLLLKMQELKKNTAENLMLYKKINNLKSRFLDYKNVEQNLYSLLSDLENKKKDMAAKYLFAKKRQDDLEVQYKQMNTLHKLKIAGGVKTVAPKVRMRFDSPIKNFKSIDYKLKGITYKFSGKNQVVATGGGKIAYTGSLSTYGNVIMIDHGNDTRTVLLGAFNATVKKNQLVKLGEVIGTTRPGRGLDTDNKLYFEIRKKNKAQNTVQLMSSNFLAKLDAKTTKQL